MRHFAQGFLAIAALIVFPAHSDAQSLACDRSEAVALDGAAPGVRRISADRLSVKWAKGTRLFVNSGLEEGELAGLRYEYCGFMPGYHLISKKEDDLFTGVLLEAASGKVLPAGHTVQFSPDAAKYFAIQQPGGLDGEEWLIYSRAGAQLWEGKSGISARAEEGNWHYFIATLEEPHWSAAGELEATLRCAADTAKTATVTLRASDGRYSWVPRIECARQSLSDVSKF